MCLKEKVIQVTVNIKRQVRNVVTTATIWHTVHILHYYYSLRSCKFLRESGTRVYVGDTIVSTVAGTGNAKLFDSEKIAISFHRIVDEFEAPKRRKLYLITNVFVNIWNFMWKTQIIAIKSVWFVVFRRPQSVA